MRHATSARAGKAAYHKFAVRPWMAVVQTECTGSGRADMGTVQWFSSWTCSDDSEWCSQDQGRLDLFSQSDEIHVVPCLDVDFSILHKAGRGVQRTGVTEVKMHGWLPSSSSYIESYQPGGKSS